MQLDFEISGTVFSFKKEVLLERGNVPDFPPREVSLQELGLERRPAPQLRFFIDKGELVLHQNREPQFLKPDYIKDALKQHIKDNKKKRKEAQQTLREDPASGSKRPKKPKVDLARPLCQDFIKGTCTRTQCHRSHDLSQFKPSQLEEMANLQLMARRRDAD